MTEPLHSVRAGAGCARALLFAFVLSSAFVAPSTATAAIDLEGTWFVLIHYRDSSTANPDSDRWDDKVWKFEKKGSRLQWTEFPIVVFVDGTGRFGRVGRNDRARLLHAWEPNEAQRAEIAAGLQVNSRGSKTKALRGNPAKGYASSSQSRSTSAFTVGYEESWKIDSLATVPVFTRDDSLGTEAALAAGTGGTSGRTLFKGLEIQDGGNVIVGEYARDDSKRGTFRLIRAGAARGIESDGRTPNEKAAERAREQIQAGMRNEAYSQFMETLGPDNLLALRATIGEDGITAVWQQYERRLIGGDESAKREIGDALRKAYEEGLQQKIAGAFATGDADAMLDATAAGLDADEVALMRDVRDTLGAEQVEELRATYGPRVRAGDEQAKAELATAIREAYIEKKEAEFAARVAAGELEALRRAREAQADGDGPRTR